MQLSKSPSNSNNRTGRPHNFYQTICFTGAHSAEGTKWALSLEIQNSVRFLVGTTEAQDTLKLTWKTDTPVWVDQWSLLLPELYTLTELVQEQLYKRTHSPLYQSLEFTLVIKKKKKEASATCSMTSRKLILLWRTWGHSSLASHLLPGSPKNDI